jgi:hypothetical protein
VTSGIEVTLSDVGGGLEHTRLGQPRATLHHRPPDQGLPVRSRGRSTRGHHRQAPHTHRPRLALTRVHAWPCGSAYEAQPVGPAPVAGT